MPTTLDVSFELVGKDSIPADHGYLLYAGLSRLWPDIHKRRDICVHPISGRQLQPRRLWLHRGSRMTIRAPDCVIGELVQLAGKELAIADAVLRIGIPQVFALRPSPSLRSRIVTIKGFLEKQPFLAAARRQLDSLGVSRNTQLRITRRRTLRVRDHEIVGFELILGSLSPDGSLAIQRSGIGGRRRMGCGVFTECPRALHH